MIRKETDKYSDIEMGRGIGFLEVLDRLDRINASIINNSSLYDDVKELSIDNITAPLDSAEEVTLVRLKGGQSGNPDKVVKSFITVVKNGVKYTGEGHTIATLIKDVILKMEEHSQGNVIKLKQVV